MHTPRADPKQRRALWWSLAGPKLRDILSVLLLAAFALAVFIGVYWNLFRNQADVRGVAPIQAEGVVTTIAYHPVDETNANPHRLALIMIDGKTLLPNPDTGGMFRTVNPPLRQGQRVRYTYRIGKSGRWYVTRIKPLPPTRD